MKREYSAYQRRVIRDYYRNEEALLFERLQKAAGDLYLAGGAKRREQLWATIGELLARLKVPAARAGHVLQSRNPRALAAVIQELFGK